MFIILLFTFLINSHAVESLSVPQSHISHMKKYEKDFKKILRTPWGKVFVKNKYAGEPVVKPNMLSIALICNNKKTKALLKDYHHCGLEDITIDKRRGRVRLHFLDADPQKGLCLKRRTKYLNISCAK